MKASDWNSQPGHRSMQLWSQKCQAKNKTLHHKLQLIHGDLQRRNTCVAVFTGHTGPFWHKSITAGKTLELGVLLIIIDDLFTL
jgi:hypothetical protein